MTDTADKIAALEAEVEALKAKVSPPKSDFVPVSDAEWIDKMHQMRERRMSHASNFHPDDLRAMEAACPTPMMKEIALRDARAPTGRPGMIPRQSASEQPWWWRSKHNWLARGSAVNAATGRGHS
jgi:hypothetical protein